MITWGTGETNATLADAIADLVTGGVPDTVRCVVTGTYTESNSFPTQAQVATDWDDRIVFDVADGVTCQINGFLTGTSAGTHYVEVHDMTVSNSGVVSNQRTAYMQYWKDCTLTGFVRNLEGGGIIHMDGCSLDGSAENQPLLHGSLGAWKMCDCKIKAGSSYLINAVNNISVIEAYNCIFDCGGVPFFGNTSNHLINVRQCSFYNATNIVEVGGSNIYSNMFDVENCIFDTFQKLINSSDELWPVLRMGGNVFSNQTAGHNLIETTNVDFADIAAIQANGEIDDTNNPSREEDVTFASTTFGDADFLKPSSAPTASKHCGINTSYDGYDRKKWSNIIAGAYQLADATEPTDAQVIEAGGGTYHEAATAEVQDGVTFGPNESYEGSYNPLGTSTAPTGLTVTDSGDGATWTVTATGSTAGAAIYLYDQSDDSLIAVVDASAETADLTAGQSIYAKALEAGSTISARYPAASGVDVPALAEVSAPTIPTLSVTDNGDDTGGIATISGADDGTTNTVYTAPYGTATWTSQGSCTGDGTVDLDLDAGHYWVYCSSGLSSNYSITEVEFLAVTTGETGDGNRNCVSRPRARGQWATIWLSSDSAWAYESLTLVAKKLGRLRHGR